MKNVRMGTDHLTPPKPKIRLARIKVATPPLLVRNFTRTDKYATTAAKKIPAAKFWANELFSCSNAIESIGFVM